MPSLDNGFSSSMTVLLQTGWRVGPPGFSRLKDAKQPGKRIVKLVHNPFLQRNNGVLRYGDILGANFAAAGGDIAETDAMRFFQFADTILNVERMHFERGDMDEETRAGKLLEMTMLPQYVAHVMAQETFDALAEFLDAIDILLRHAPGTIGRVRRVWPEFPNAFLHAEVPGDIGDQVLDGRERAHRLHSHPLIEAQRI